jgi:hypothetical protein
MNYHLAQANIARMRAIPGTSEMEGLVSRIDEMNRLAEASNGFVWRLKGSEIAPDALSIFADYIPCGNDRLFYNMSVWESIEDLKNYAFNSRHSEMLRNRQIWIEQFERAHSVLWWIPAGHFPTIEDSLARLRTVDENGPTEYAFTFKNTFERPVTSEA